MQKLALKRTAAEKEAKRVERRKSKLGADALSMKSLGSVRSSDGNEFIVEEDENKKTMEYEDKLMNEILESKLGSNKDIEPISEEDHQSADYEEDVENFFKQVNKNDTTTP